MSTILDALRKLQEEAAAEKRRSENPAARPAPVPEPPKPFATPLDLSKAAIPTPLSDDTDEAVAEHEPGIELVDEAAAPEPAESEVERIETRSEVIADVIEEASGVVAPEPEADDELAVAPPPEPHPDQRDGAVVSAEPVSDGVYVSGPQPETADAHSAMPESAPSAPVDLPVFEPEAPTSGMRQRLRTWGGIAAGVLAVVVIGQFAFDYFFAPAPVVPVAKKPVQPAEANPAAKADAAKADKQGAGVAAAKAKKTEAPAKTAAASPSAGGPPRASTRAPASNTETAKPDNAVAKAKPTPAVTPLSQAAAKIPPPSAGTTPPETAGAKAAADAMASETRIAKLEPAPAVKAPPAHPRAAEQAAAPPPAVAPPPSEPEVLLKAPAGAPQVSLVFVQYAREPARRMASVRNAAGTLLVLREGDLADPSQGLKVSSIGRNWVDFAWRNEVYRIFMNEF